MARATKDGRRRLELSRDVVTCGQAARIARAHGLDMTPGDVEALCGTWAFDCFPSVPWSEAREYDGWVWLIDPKDFASWCEWQAERETEGVA